MIFGKHIVYKIYEGGLTERLYREILEEVIPELMKNVILALNIAVYFQQDSAHSHNSALPRLLLNDGLVSKDL